MPVAKAITGIGWEDSGAVLMARLVNTDGDNITIVAVAENGIVLNVQDKAIPGVHVAASPYTLVTSTVVFDAVQTPANKPIWTFDSTGYNFRYDTLAAQLPEGNKTYIFEVWVTPTSGQRYMAVRAEVESKKTIDD